MMKLYHGSTEIVERPAILRPNRPLDYGSGFYTTTSYEQAEQWVKRRLKEKSLKEGYVSIFNFDETFMAGMKTLIFHKPTEEWVDFVMKNRIQKGFNHDYDIVYGPVANDRVYAQFALFEGNIISKQTLIRELKTYKLVDQYLFHTERGLTAIKFIEAKEVAL